MLRRLLIYTLVVLFILPAMAFANGSDLTVMDKASAVENILYGDVQTGALVDRVGKIETDMYGAVTNDALMTRVDRVYRYMTDNSAEPSFQTKLNAVEWALSHSVTTQPAKTRIENMEMLMVGGSPRGSLDDRLTKLTQLAYPDGKVNVAVTTVNKDNLVKIKILSPLSTKESRVGDSVNYQVSEDVYAGDLLVIPSGAYGTGKVTKVEAAQNFGRDAKLEIAFDRVVAIDGKNIETLLGDKAKAETKSMATAAGASVAGMIILGPIGIVGGAFIHGKDITIPVGTEIFIQTKEDTQVYGIKVR